MQILIRLKNILKAPQDQISFKWDLSSHRKFTQNWVEVLKQSSFFVLWNLANVDNQNTSLVLLYFSTYQIAGRDWGQEEKGTTEDEMAGWHHWLDGHEFE